jgi:hypothetical protein
VKGDFKVVAGRSQDGGALCPVPPPPDGECKVCKGGVTSLTLQYNGTLVNPTIKVYEGKDAKADKLIFSGTPDANGQITFQGVKKGEAMGANITIVVNGGFKTAIHTSCSQPIGPGLVRGDFTVVAGTSKDGGALCPIPPPGGDGSFCKDLGKPNFITLQYDGGNCSSSTTTQPSGKFACSDSGGGPGTTDPVFVVGGASDVFKGTVFLAGTEFTVPTGGKANTFLKIYTADPAAGGQLRQSLQIHTSCSAPLIVGEKFGALVLTELSK